VDRCCCARPARAGGGSRARPILGFLDKTLDMKLPRVVAPSREPAVLILTGAPGSGKTTVAALLALTSDRGVHLQSDCFFRFIVSGYVEPWKEESHEQNTTVMKIVGAAAGRYASAGYSTIIDGIVSPRWFFEPLRDSLKAAGLDVAYAVLRPPLAVAVARARGRASSRLSDDAVIEQLWSGFADLGPLERHVINNEAQTPKETAEQVAQRLREGTLTV
jgi:adenylate kinase family enzyme